MVDTNQIDPHIYTFLQIHCLPIFTDWGKSIQIRIVTVQCLDDQANLKQSFLIAEDLCDFIQDYYCPSVYIPQICLPAVLQSSVNWKWGRLSHSSSLNLHGLDVYDFSFVLDTFRGVLKPLVVDSLVRLGDIMVKTNMCLFQGRSLSNIVSIQNNFRELSMEVARSVYQQTTMDSNKAVTVPIYIDKQGDRDNNNNTPSLESYWEEESIYELEPIGDVSNQEELESMKLNYSHDFAFI